MAWLTSRPASVGSLELPAALGLAQITQEPNQSEVAVALGPSLTYQGGGANPGTSLAVILPTWCWHHLHKIWGPTARDPRMWFGPSMDWHYPWYLASHTCKQAPAPGHPSHIQQSAKISSRTLCVSKSSMLGSTSNHQWAVISSRSTQTMYPVVSGSGSAHSQARQVLGHP